MPCWGLIGDLLRHPLAWAAVLSASLSAMPAYAAQSCAMPPERGMLPAGDGHHSRNLPCCLSTTLVTVAVQKRAAPPPAAGGAALAAWRADAPPVHPRAGLGASFLRWPSYYARSKRVLR